MINSFVTLLRRELWEQNSLKWMPLLLLLFILLANLAVMYAAGEHGIITIGGDSSVTTIEITSGDETLTIQQDEATGIGTLAQSQKVVRGVLYAVALLINVVLQVLMIFYLLDALYGERKDYSILFWKSLPLSDSMIVLSKLVFAAIVIPLISLVTMMLAQVMTLALQSYTLAEVAGPVSLWQQAELAGFWRNIFILLMEQSIWLFPVMGWLLLCSVWSRRSPFIPAVIIPLLVIFVDSGFRLNTNISAILLERLPLGFISIIGLEGIRTPQPDQGFTAKADISSWWDTMGSLDLAGFVDFLSGTKVWLGIIVGLILVGITIWLRHRQGDNL